MRPARLILFLSALFALPAAVPAEPWKPAGICPTDPDCPRDREEPQVCQRLSEPLLFNQDQVVVVMQQWQIGNLQTTEIPHKGLLIVQLRAGSVTTRIGDERKEWRTGSFWSVPPGQSLMVYTQRDSVVLQTVDFQFPVR